MLTRYPDAPIASHATVLGNLRETEFLAQFKHDGWRCVIELDSFGSATFTSRHGKPLPVSGDVRHTTAAALAANAPPGSVFDAEWMGRRDGQPESIVVFDVLRHGLAWVTQAPLIDRWLLLHDLCPHELIVAHALTHYREFFEASRRPGVEGIVLKHLNSRYIGGRSVGGCSNNSWLKIRHRAGEDGQLKVA